MKLYKITFSHLSFKTKKTFFFGLSLFLLSMSTAAQHLLRKGMLGIAYYTQVPNALSDSLGITNKAGALVKELVPNATAITAGVLPLDYIIRINKTTVIASTQLPVIASTLIAGDDIEFQVIRNKQAIILNGKVIEKSKEVIPNAQVLYDEFPFQGGYVRCFLKTPTNQAPKGTVYFLPGIYCISLDNLPKNNPYYLVQEHFLKAGYQIFIAEKACMGDSKSNITCSQMGFNDEIALYREGYKKLFQYQNIQPRNVILFGHSLGGLAAPILANEFKPKAVIVFGTGISPWKDYLLKAHHDQSILLGEKRSLVKEQMKQLVPLANALFNNPAILPEILKDTCKVEILKMLGYETETGQFAAGRSLQFHREINQTNMVEEWNKVSCHVLSLYGEADLPALNDKDHKALVAIVNKNYPGKATYRFVPKTNHPMQEVGTMKQFIKMMDKPEYENYASQRFNHTMMQDIIKWCDGL